MKIWAVMVLCLVMGGMCVGQMASDKDAKTDSKAMSKDKLSKWQGQIKDVKKDKMTMTVNGAPNEKMRFEHAADKEVVCDANTEWTKAGKPATMDDFKEGDWVNVVGHSQKDGTFHAVHVDLRPAKKAM